MSVFFFFSSNLLSLFFFKANRDALEAGQALLVVACLIAQYLALASLLPPGLDPAPVLARICPYLKASAALLTFAFVLSFLSLQCPEFVGVTRADVDNKMTAMRLEVSLD